MQNKHKSYVNRFFIVFLGTIILSGTVATGCGTDSQATGSENDASGQKSTDQSVALVYELTVEGTAKEAGVISFLDYSINVYRDPASNSCGDCADQPVHLYAGATAADATQAISDAVARADDLWTVSSVDDSHVVLTEKDPGTVSEKDLNELETPPGLVIKDNFGHFADGTVQSSASGEKTIYNIDQTPIRVPTDVERIAAVYGPSYEAMVVLGQEDRVVVCSDVQKDDFPWAVTLFPHLAELPCLENVHTSVNTEELMMYKPDLVLAFSRPNELKQMESLGISAIPGRTTTTLAEIPQMLHVYAHAIGHGANERADLYETYFNTKLSYVLDRTKDLSDLDRPAVYYAGIDLLTTYGAFSDIPEVIEVAGGHCVTEDLKAGNHTQVSFEQLAAWNPDYIFIDHGNIGDNKTVEELKTDVLSSSRYKEISAVKNDQVILSPSGVFYWDMGLQKILLVMYMAKTLHPDLFSDLDMSAELIEFYDTFYSCSLTKEDAEKILNRKDP